MTDSARVPANGTALPTRMCSHPEWAGPGPKPEAAEMRYFCKCGQNYGCPVCMWGAGAMPCRCDRERMSANARLGGNGD